MLLPTLHLVAEAAHQPGRLFLEARNRNRARRIARRRRIRRYRGAASGLRQGSAAIVVPELAATVDDISVAMALADKLAKFEQPNTLIVVDQPPRNTMAKAQTSLLRESHAHLSSD